MTFKKRFKQNIIENRRWTILYLLNLSPVYSSNEDIILMLLQDAGIPIYIDELQHDLQHLERHGLVRIDHFTHLPGGKSLMVVDMTPEGKQVYDGVRSVPGVKQHGPTK